MEVINITYTFDCADSFISMELETLNAIEYDIKFDLIPDCCETNRIGIDIPLTICRPFEKLLAEDVSEVTYEKFFKIFLNVLLTTLGEDL